MLECVCFRTPLLWRACLWGLLLIPAFSSADPLSGRPASFISNLQPLDLIDQDGKVFQADSLVNHVVLFNFIYTDCASVCSLQTHVLAQVLQALPVAVREQVRFVSVSIDPVNDTPARLAEFSRRLHADLAGWWFLTGNAPQIEQLTRRLHLLDESEAAQGSVALHRSSLWLVDKEGRMLQRFQGDPPDKDRLIRELSQVSRMDVAR